MRLSRQQASVASSSLWLPSNDRAPPSTIDGGAFRGRRSQGHQGVMLCKRASHDMLAAKLRPGKSHAIGLPPTVCGGLEAKDSALRFMPGRESQDQAEGGRNEYGAAYDGECYARHRSTSRYKLAPGAAARLARSFGPATLSVLQHSSMAIP